MPPKKRIIKKEVKGCGVLPYAIKGKEVYLLLGKEREVDGWWDSNKYADFGGGIEKNESSKQCAIRECYEESMGILGSSAEIKAKLEKTRVEPLYDESNCSMTYFMKIPFDKTIETTFKNVYEYFKKCSYIKGGTHVLPGCEHGFFEKSRVKWFSLKELKQKLSNELYKKQFRKYFISNLKKMAKETKFV